MRWYRSLSLLLPVAGVVFLAGALRGPAPKAMAQPPLAPQELAGLGTEAADPVATSHVAEALAALQGPSREWLQAGVWVRSRLPELPYEAEGVYYRAPQRRFRLEVRVRHDAGRHGERTVVTGCDGLTTWQATRAPGGDRDTCRQPEKDAGHLRGPEALLRSFEHVIAWVRSAPEADGVTVTGIWHPAARRTLAPADRPWPASLPRACRLTLRGRDRWPARIEWYGPTTDGGPDRLLVEMEFREPRCGRPLSDDECRRLFTADHGKAASIERPTR
jgi:hypothetical protein